MPSKAILKVIDNNAQRLITWLPFDLWQSSSQIQAAQQPITALQTKHTCENISSGAASVRQDRVEISTSADVDSFFLLHVSWVS